MSALSAYGPKDTSPLPTEQTLCNMASVATHQGEDHLSNQKLHIAFTQNTGFFETQQQLIKELTLKNEGLQRELDA